MLEQLLDRAGDAVAVEWVGVLVARNDEELAGFQPAVPGVVPTTPSLFRSFPEKTPVFDAEMNA